ncbi:MAG: T9SS type A sorting domain-containing protein [Ferruginibacter sp.]
MKNLYLLLITSLLINTSNAQITTPVIKANFGVEADLACNYFGAPQPGNDDWFSNGNSGTGSFVIDTTGAAALVAAYTTNPLTRMLSFSRFMRVAPYTTVNNRIWLDAIFHRDFHGTDSTVFAAGSNKNGMSPVNWTAPVAQNIPDKNDILDAFTHIRRAGPNLTDSLWMFGAISLDNINGNRYFDFELYQTDIRFNRTTLNFLGYGPDEGHTTWLFDAAGNILKAGDIIFSAEYGSSSLTNLEARIWINKASLLMTPTAFNWGGLFDGASSGSTFGYASILPKTAGAYYTGLQCGNGVWPGPFSLVLQNNTLSSAYTARQFMEFSINLSKLGLDPGRFGINPCGSPFRRVLIKTRASTSFTAELKDFIAPFSLFNYAPVQAHAYLIYFCGSMPNTTIYVTNPNPDLEYTWSTTNGRIVGSNTGISIVVDRPGTYVVVQQFDPLCPEHSRDSVTIMFDSICTVLNVNLLKFTAAQLNGKANLKWDASNNELASTYDIEYSLDNETFSKLVTVRAGLDSGIVSFNYQQDLTNTRSSVITYRIKVTGKTGQVKYSNTILLRLGENKIPQPEIFPNPSSGKAWVAINSSDNSSAEIFVTDAYGRPVSKNTYMIKKGENVIELLEMKKLASALYIVKIKTSEGVSTHKIIIKK